MKKYFKSFVSITVVMIVLDFIWLGVVAQPIYQRGIGHLMAAQRNIGFAALLYIVYEIGLIVFTIAPYSSKLG